MNTVSPHWIIYQLHERGSTLTAIGKALNVSTSFVSKTLRKPGKPRPIRTEIARVLGCHPWPKFAARDGWKPAPDQPQDAAWEEEMLQDKR